MATSFLQGLNAPDLGLHVNGEDFAATTDMTETLNQVVTYGDAFGSDGPVLRTVRRADEDTVSFTAILLKQGVNRGLADEEAVRKLRDFQIIIKRGSLTVIYTNCNWTTLTITSGIDQVTMAATVSVPGLNSRTVKGT